MDNWEGAAVIGASVIIGWLLVVGTMPAWNKGAVMFTSAVAFVTLGVFLWFTSPDSPDI